VVFPGIKHGATRGPIFRPGRTDPCIAHFFTLVENAGIFFIFHTIFFSNSKFIWQNTKFTVHDHSNFLWQLLLQNFTSRKYRNKFDISLYKHSHVHILKYLGLVYTQKVWVGAQRNGVFWLGDSYNTNPKFQSKHSISLGSNPKYFGVNRPLVSFWEAIKYNIPLQGKISIPCT